MSDYCLECGRELSFWDKFLKFKIKLCPVCRVKMEEKVNTYLQKVMEFGEDKYLTKEEEQYLDNLKKSLELRDEDIRRVDNLLEILRNQTKEANTNYYFSKLREFGEDQRLTVKEETELKKIMKELDLTEDDISFSRPFYNHIKFLTQVTRGKLPIIMSDIILKRDEECHYEIECSLIEEKTNTRYEGKSSSVSIRLAKGVYYRVGQSKGRKIVDTYDAITDTGYLYITTKRVIFVGGKKNVTYPINKIVDYILYKDGIQFQKENESKSKFFNINDEFAVDEVGALLLKLTKIED
jgi:hypothetical protein